MRTQSRDHVCSLERCNRSGGKWFCLDTFPLYEVRFFLVVSLYAGARHITWS
jgi:hypothetical protein